VRAVLRQTKPFSSLWRARDCAPYLIVFLLLSWQTARAQFAPADVFFDSGAQFYISNNIPSALEKTENGLKIYPDNEKLKKLEALLKQQQKQNQQQQNRQNQSQQQKSQQNSNGQKNQQQQNQQQNSQAQQKPEGQKQNQSAQKKDGQQKQSEQQKSSAQKQENQNAEGQPVQPGQMTPEEAKRLLDSQKGGEQVLQLKPQGKPENPNQPVKDW
jgi:Ca-activated chloride channel family protein